MKILEKLKSLKSAKSFEDEIPKLEESLASAREEHARLHASRENALFEGGNDALTKLSAEIERAKADIELIEVALAGAKRRHGEALDRETADRLEALAKEAAKDVPAIVQEYSQFAVHAAALADLADSIKRRRERMKKANFELVEGGRADLKISDPILNLAGVAGRSIRDPLAGLNISEFYPRHPDGPALVKNGDHLSKS